MTAQHPTAGIIIIGGGQAGIQLADSLRGEGWEGAITVFSDESHQPYQRPPLSKDFIAAGSVGTALPLRGTRFFADSGIDFRPGVSVVSIDREAHTVTTDDRLTWPYSSLVFATGARNRELPTEGATLRGVHYLRTLDDATALQSELGTARRAVVIGAGFIGLEFAASARARGLEVTVFENGPRLMGRVLSEPMSAYFQAKHAGDGIDLRLGDGVASFVGVDGWVTAAIGSDTTVYPADLVVIGIGVIPNSHLAEASGIGTANGIVVDAQLRTSDPHVFALGDCCSFPSAWDGEPGRLESVQNATDQAKALAKTLVGRPTEYRATPWFWSQQGSARLQIVGVVRAGDEAVLRGDVDSGKFSVYNFRGDALAGVESVNSAADHMGARRLLDGGITLTRAQASDDGFDIKAHSRAVPVVA